MTAEFRNKTVILHIGRHKTGTSSIQQTLAANRNILLSRGVLYPRSLPTNQSGFFVNVFSKNPGRHLHHGDKKIIELILNRVKQKFPNLKDELKGFKGEKIVFSAEDAGTVLNKNDILNMKRILDQICGHPKYNILLYTRHPVSWASSAIQQNVKGNGMAMEDCVKFRVSGRSKLYEDIYRNYSFVFSPETIFFRSFEHAVAHKKGLIGDFFEIIGVNDQNIIPKKANEGISPEIIHFLSWLYERSETDRGVMIRNRQMRVPLTENDKALLFGIKGGNASFLTYAEQQKLWAAVAGDMVFLRESFGIYYRPPVPFEPQPLFTEDFLENLRVVLPGLSQPVCREMMRFLDTKISAGAAASLRSAIDSHLI